MKEIVPVRLAVDPKTGAADLASPFMAIRSSRGGARSSALPGRGGIYDKEPGVIEQFRLGENQARFEAEWDDETGNWIFGKRVADA